MLFILTLQAVDDEPSVGRSNGTGVFHFCLYEVWQKMSEATFLTKYTKTYILKSYHNQGCFLGRPYSWAVMLHVPRTHRIPLWSYLWSHARNESSKPHSQIFFTWRLPRGPMLYHPFYAYLSDLSSNAPWLLKKIISQKINLSLMDKDLTTLRKFTSRQFPRRVLEMFWVRSASLN